MASINKMLFLLSSRERFYLSLIFIGLTLMAFIEMASIASIMPFMAIVANPDVIETNRWLNSAFHFLGFTEHQGFLIFVGIVVLLLMVLTNMFKALMIWATLHFDNYLNSRLAQRLLARYLAMPYVFFLNRNTADMGKNILNEARNVVAGVLSPGIKIVSNSLIAVFILSLLLIVNPVIALSIALILGGSYSTLYYFVRRRLSAIGEEQLQANLMKFKSAGEALGGIKDLKVLGRENYFLNIFSHHADRHAHNNVISGSISQLPKFFLEILAFGGILLIVLYFLQTEQNAAQMIPLLALYAFAGYRLMPALQEIFANITMLRSSTPSLDVLHRDMAGTGECADIPIPRTPPEVNPLPFSNSLELRKVSFYYPESARPAMDQADIRILPNTTIGLVGTTGSGKTTTADIILGLLRPASGALVVDGVIVDDDNVARWQMNLGYVPQHIYLTDDTLARNIAFGVADADIDMDAVRRAARIANLAEFVEQELPRGYETIIGERGVRLSGGQRQRIGIARALYLDPPVLVMDEATSALDGVTETAVMDAIRNLSGKKTIILIAHRLTTIKDCDVIYQMEKGRVVNQGTYEALKKTSKWFHTAAGNHP